MYSVQVAIRADPSQLLFFPRGIARHDKKKHCAVMLRKTLVTGTAQNTVGNGAGVIT